MKGRSTPVEKLEWIKLSSLRGEHGTAMERFSRTQEEHRQIDWSEVRVELLMRSREFSGAERIIAEGLARAGRNNGLQGRLAEVQTLRRLDDEFRAAPGGQERDYAAYCINLDEHREKWERCEREGKQTNMALERLPGVKGGYLPDGVMSRFGPKVSRNLKGTLGCFLSHYRAWERFLATDRHFALILEDDFRPKVKFPDRLAALEFPGEFDICWLNDRMQTQRSGAFGYVEARDVLARRASPHWLANGNEGYAISRTGAEKLIQRVDEDGFFGDPDWRMLTYSVDEAEIETLAEDTFAKKAMTAHLSVTKPREPLLAYAASTGLIAMVETGSGRLQQNARIHAHQDI
jgi:GR25 family glycosyltransferase involved in LPS biosynthesis